MPTEKSENPLDLSERELEEAEDRSAVRAHVVYEAIRLEGEEELKRPSSALAWSGLAAGLSMGFSMIGEGVLRARLPDAPWRPLLTKLGYSFGFLIVILGRQQLFTENTLTPVLPMLNQPSYPRLFQVLRLWFFVFVANMVGAFAVAWAMGNTGAFHPEVRHAFTDIGRETLAVTFGTALLRGVFAGWLIALLVWLLPFAESSRVLVIILLTWLIGAGQFTHVVAGAVEAMYMGAIGAAPWTQCAFGYILPTLIGNIIGGVSLVAAINHAQITSK